MEDQVLEKFQKILTQIEYAKANKLQFIIVSAKTNPIILECLKRLGCSIQGFSTQPSLGMDWDCDMYEIKF